MIERIDDVTFYMQLFTYRNKENCITNVPLVMKMKICSRIHFSRNNHFREMTRTFDYERDEGKGVQSVRR